MIQAAREILLMVLFQNHFGLLQLLCAHFILVPLQNDDDPLEASFCLVHELGLAGEHEH